MVFSSLIFLFSYLPFMLIGNYIWRNRTWQNVLLFVGSLIFYAWGEGERVIIMFLSICMNYMVGRYIESAKGRNRRVKLTIGIVLNLAVLVYFKYAYFTVINVQALLNSLGWDVVIPVKKETLPLGITFYTFQSISYIVDVYRKETKAQRSFIDVGLYIALFPQLIAGPIVRYHDIAQQLRHRIHSLDKFTEGIKRFIIGLGKKVLIANTIAYTADEILILPADELSFSLVWMGILAYAIQLYFDFSGYSDMAIGLGKMFGFDILENFNYPYISKSVKEFWRRWHISLGNWFMDYLYIPLGGNRGSTLQTIRNLSIVFFIVGFWHGANWNFVYFGMFMGLFMILERFVWGRILERAWAPLQHFYTLMVVFFSWAIFRIEDLDKALTLQKIMLGFNGPKAGFYSMEAFGNPLFWTVFVIGSLGSTPLFTFVYNKLPNKGGIAIRTLNASFYIFVLLLSIISLINSTYNPFIYFRF